MPPLVEKPPGHDDRTQDEDEDEEDESLPGISVASYSTLPSGGYTFIADGSDSSVAGAVSTTSFQMPGALSIHHTPVGPTTSSQHEFSFPINTRQNHPPTSPASHLRSRTTGVGGGLAMNLADDIASAPRGRSKHHFVSDVGEGLVRGDGEVVDGGGYIPRPPNAFILFRSSFIRSQKISGKVEGNHSQLSKIIGRYWRALEPAQRAEWETKAKIAQDEHRERYPDWRFRPGSSKNNAPRGRGKRGKGGGRKGRLKTKDGGEENNSAERSEVPAGARKSTAGSVDKGKGKGRERDGLAVDNGKGKARDVEPEISLQKVSILTPHDPPTLKRPYYTGDGTEKSSASSHTNYEAPFLPSSSTSKSFTTTNHNTSAANASARSIVSTGPGPSASKDRPPVITSSPGSIDSVPSSPKKTPAPGAKPHSEPSPTKEELRIRQITQLLMQGKEGIELEQELERWEKGEEEPETVGERGGAPPSGSPEVPNTPPSDLNSNTPSSTSTTDTDAHTQRGDWNFSGTGPWDDRRGTRQFLDPDAPTHGDEERDGNYRRRSSSAPAPRGRALVPSQIPQHPESHADAPSTIDESRNGDVVYAQEEEQSTVSTWNSSYEGYFNSYEQPQQSPSPFLPSPLSSDHGHGHDQQSQGQWTYPPYPPPETQVASTESSLGPDQYRPTPTFRSRSPLHRHTRTRSHIYPIQTFPPSERNMALSPTTSDPYSPGSMISPTHSVHSPITPSSAPPGFGVVPPSQPERAPSMPRRGSIAFPISSAASTAYPSSGSFPDQGSAVPQQFNPVSREERVTESVTQSLTWEAVESERRQLFQEQESEGAHTYGDEGYRLEHVYPSPDTRDMGWIVSSDQRDSYQPFSPVSDDPGTSNMDWEQAGEGRQGIVTCIVDPYLQGSGVTQSDMEIASPIPPPASSYSSLTGWAGGGASEGEPVIRISPPNIYDRRDKQSDIWETDDEVGFGFGFGRRGG